MTREEAIKAWDEWRKNGYSHSAMPNSMALVMAYNALRGPTREQVKVCDDYCSFTDGFAGSKWRTRPMKRLIDAEDLKKEIKSAFSGKIGLTVTSAIHEIIDRRPTIDPENLRPRAYWKNKGEKTYVIWCSNCGEPYYHDFEDFKYCPNCGCFMENKNGGNYVKCKGYEISKLENERNTKE